MKKFEITFSREVTSMVVVEGETMAEAVELIENEFDFYGGSPWRLNAMNACQEVRTVGKPSIKAVVEVNTKQRLDEG